MPDWGPADWYVIGLAVAGALGVLWAITSPSAWSEWRESFRRLPPSDPRYKVPYKRP